MVKKLLFIVNPRAGRTKSRAPLFDAVSIFSDAGFLVCVRCTAGRGDATRFAAEEGADYDVVVCSGGDGTLNETMMGLMRLDREKRPLLGYLPQGSTNDFASSLNISGNPVDAADAIVHGSPKVLDVGRFQERCFVYVASFGAFAKSSYSASQSAKNALGHFAYILEGMKDLNTLRPYRVRIDADGEVFDGEYLFGAICNSTSIGGLMRLDPENVVLDDGKFELLLVPSPKNPIELQNLLLALLSQQYEQGGLIFRHVSHVRVETEEELSWSLDGEYAPSEPTVEIENIQGALDILL
ncbi:diacylglycerol kinase family lipid kinase [Oscillibacter hominis]|uniref:Diacylglycerol kinase family lipid kinase n=1 Tax=Oscillibacter hominis TaxID=2763056 RepID=A0A7G9B4D9_9FIRM|nr:diacylglycerol kinase family protein [Oscillibacter hominis]QNL44420.1 diacylglycerol kinase family lipid kinase [Oscillibacter hominis]